MTVAKGVGGGAGSGVAVGPMGRRGDFGVNEAGPLEYVILTDSNGQDMGPNNIWAHIPRDLRGRGRGPIIRVEIAYTLMMVCDSLERGALRVQGAVVILDVATTDLRGTDGWSQTWWRGDMGKRSDS